MTSKEYYDKYLKQPNEDICYCGNHTSWGKAKYHKYCSSDCATKSEEHRKKVSLRFAGNDRDKKIELLKQRRGKVDPNVDKRRYTILQKWMLVVIVVILFFY